MIFTCVVLDFASGKKLDVECDIIDELHGKIRLSRFIDKVRYEIVHQFDKRTGSILSIDIN